jgi:hypothetical protein
MREPAEIVEDVERHPELPPGSEERFFGYQDQPAELACTR